MVANFKLHPFIFLKGLKSWGHYGGRNKENQIPREREGEAAWPGHWQLGLEKGC